MMRPERYVIPALVGLAPVALLLLTWRPDGQFTGAGNALKWLAGPVLVAEFFVVLVALARGGLAALRSAAVPRIASLAAAALAAIAVGTALFAAPDPRIAGILTAVWILHGLYALSVVHLCGTAFDRGSLTTAIMAGFALFAALIVAFVLAIPDPAAFDWIGGLPAVSNLRHLGFYAGAVLGLCIGRLAVVRSRVGYAATVAVAALAFALPLWNGTRGTFAAVGGALVLGLVLFPHLRRPRVLAGLLAGLVLGGALVSRLPVPNELWGPQRMVATATNGDVSSDRNNLWLVTIGSIATRPLFGHGEGQIQAATGRGEIHPHNSVLQVLHAWGFAGAACVFVLALLFARFALRTVRARGGECLPPAMAVIVLAVYSAHDGTLLFPLSVSLAAACAGLVAARQRAGDAAAGAAGPAAVPPLEPRLTV
ncbi:MAG TPA: O-antigen ligase family protein [Microvirga sp.]|jgi:O-antigen ligase|nr:O-antigen ligase family protein [Microvirga sp.]